MVISLARTPVLGLRSVSLFFVIALVYSFSNEAHAAGPTISGTPPTTVRVNQYYRFTPTARDPDTAQRSLRFSIVNAPPWAQFSIYGGTLKGLPTSAGRWSNIQISVTDGRTTARLPAFTITAGTPTTTPPPPSTSAPTISGSPATSVRVGSAYSFTPTARDPNGDRLTFSISNRPSWASFSTSTGRLSGTPTSAQVGTYSNIVIRVSDGRTTVSLPAFNIAVTDVSAGSATLTWTPPTRNADGSTLSNLAGYRIVYGTSPTSLNRTMEVRNPGISTYVVENLSPATYYFAVRAFTSTGTESANSNVASKVVR